MLDRLRQPVYGADDGAACATFCSRGWKQTFLVAAEAGAPAIGDSKAGGGAAALYLGAGPCRFQMTPSLQVIVTPIRRQPAGLVEAGHAVGADQLSLKKSAIFVLAIGFSRL